MKLSDNQKRAMKRIEKITGHFNKDQWFIQEEVIGAGYRTMMALVNKGLLRIQHIDNINYYQLKNND